MKVNFVYKSISKVDKCLKYLHYQNIPFDLDVLEDKNYKINYCITVDVDENTKEKIERELDFISNI